MAKPNRAGAAAREWAANPRRLVEQECRWASNADRETVEVEMRAKYPKPYTVRSREVTSVVTRDGYRNRRVVGVNVRAYIRADLLPLTLPVESEK